MRARYAAFARGDVDFLRSTLSMHHPDRASSAADWRRAREGVRYLGLEIFHARTAGNAGEVLFRARIFKGGVDRSFVELSRFVREEGRWTYREGEIVPPEAIDALREKLRM